MDHSPYIEQQLANSQRTVVEKNEEIRKLKKLLIEAMTLCTEGPGAPTRELWVWWRMNGPTRPTELAVAALQAVER